MKSKKVTLFLLSSVSVIIVFSLLIHFYRTIHRPVRIMVSTPESRPPSNRPDLTKSYKYGMDIFGPSWQWIFPRKYQKQVTNVRQLNRLLNQTLDYDKLNRLLYNTAKAGVAWSRLAIRPSLLKLPKQYYQSEWYWQDLDAVVNLSRAYNINTVGYIFGSPCSSSIIAQGWLATKCFDIATGDQFKVPPPTDIWKSTLKDIFQRYSSPGNEKILYYEIWNEPDLDGFFMPGKPMTDKAKEYLRLFREALEVRDEVNPKIKLVFGGVSDIKGHHFLRAVVNQPNGVNLINQAEAVSMHAYGEHTVKVDKVINSLGGKVNKPIWITEFNNSEFKFKNSLPQGWLGNIMSELDRRYNVAKVFWFRAVTGQWGPGLFTKAGKEWENTDYVISRPFYDDYKTTINQTVYIGDLLAWQNIISGQKPPDVVPPKDLPQDRLTTEYNPQTNKIRFSWDFSPDLSCDNCQPPVGLCQPSGVTDRGVKCDNRTNPPFWWQVVNFSDHQIIAKSYNNLPDNQLNVGPLASNKTFYEVSCQGLAGKVLRLDLKLRDAKGNIWSQAKSVTYQCPAPTPSHRRGDVNGNNLTFDRGDVLCAINKYLSLKNKTVTSPTYDVNNDRIFNRQDVLVYIFRYVSQPRSGFGRCQSL